MRVSPLGPSIVVALACELASGIAGCGASPAASSTPPSVNANPPTASASPTAKSDEGSGTADATAEGTKASLDAERAAKRAPEIATTGSELTAAKTAPSASGANPDAAYDPCPHDKPCRIMPLGDSITAGFGSTKNGGYRVELFRKAHEAGQSLTFIGTMRGGPASVDGVAFPAANEGHGGYTIDDSAHTRGISKLATRAIRQFHPHVVTLMIGTNDISNYLDITRAPARLGALMDAIIAADPNVLLIVAQIIPIALGNVDPKVVAYNSAIPPLVASRAAAGAHVVLVDMHSAFTKNARYPKDYMFDYVHPNDRGYAAMGDVWYGAIAGYLH
jgi:lysophospholipase L1-like esterase